MYILIHLFERGKGREIELPLSGMLPKCLQELGLSQGKTSSHYLDLGV